jgi:hypothetical protein
LKIIFSNLKLLADDFSQVMPEAWTHLREQLEQELVQRFALFRPG